jgi:hypothetical protein
MNTTTEAEARAWIEDAMTDPDDRDSAGVYALEAMRRLSEAERLLTQVPNGAHTGNCRTWQTNSNVECNCWMGEWLKAVYAFLEARA